MNRFAKMKKERIYTLLGTLSEKNEIQNKKKTNSTNFSREPLFGAIFGLEKYKEKTCKCLILTGLSFCRRLLSFCGCGR